MKFVITSMFGALEEIRSGIAHKGIDLAMPKGTHLRSIANGVVENVTNYSGSIGKGVIIRTDEGTRYIYGHMDKISVHTGDKIHSGDFLGWSGNSGNSTGPHLHFGMWKDGDYRDPSAVIDKVDAYAGNTFHLFQGSGILSMVGDHIKEKAKESTQEAINGVFEALGEAVVDISYSAALIGGGILILLKQVGFEHRWLKPGVLILAHVLIRFLLGGI